MFEVDRSMDKRSLTETDIRTKYITPAIVAAGWNSTPSEPVAVRW